MAKKAALKNNRKRVRTTRTTRGTRGVSSNRAAKIGAGAAAAAAVAIAGGYVLWEKMGKRRRAKVKAWVAKARKETAQKLAKAKRIGEVEYRRIVDDAVKRYGASHGIHKAELIKTASRLKAEWKRIESQAKSIARQGRGKDKKSGSGAT